MFMPLRRVLESLLIEFCYGKLVGGINWGWGSGGRLVKKIEEIQF